MATKKSNKPSDKFYADASEMTLTPAPKPAAPQSFTELPYDVDADGFPLPAPAEEVSTQAPVSASKRLDPLRK